MTKKRAYCKNTVQGSQRGRKYPPKLRAEVVMAMVASNNVCAVARRYKVPESTIRSWLAEEAAKGDAFAEARQAAAREIAVRASIGAKEQVAYLQGRVAESQRAAEIRAKLDKRLEEGVRAGDAEVGALLKTEQEALADAAEVGLVVYNSPGSYDRKLLDNDRRQLEALREHFPRHCPHAADRLRYRPLGQPQRGHKLGLGPSIDQHAARYVDGLLPDLQALDRRLELGFG